MLNGKEYRFRFTKQEIQIAKDNGFVIVSGKSDDLMEFDGYIYDEAGCFDGGKVYVSETDISDEEFPNSRWIEALWCNDEIKDADGSLITWTYRTDIPHETFMIYEDGEAYCRGIVFDIKDLKNMTEQKASKVLKMFLHKDCDIERTKFAYTDTEIWRAVKMASETLDKQIEMELLPPTEFIYKGICPVCGNRILLSEKYCSKCGQKVGKYDKNRKR